MKSTAFLISQIERGDAAPNNPYSSNLAVKSVVSAIARHARPVFLQKAISYGVNPNAFFESSTPIMDVVWGAAGYPCPYRYDDQLSCLKLLCSLPGVNLSKVNQFTKANPLMDAVGLGLFHLIPFLLSVSNTSQQDGKGNTALSIAAFTSGMSENLYVLALICQCSDCDHQNNNAETPLMIAAGRGYLDHIKILKHCSDHNIHNKNGETAIELAAANKHQKVAESLMDFSSIFSVIKANTILNQRGLGFTKKMLKEHLALHQKK